MLLRKWLRPISGAVLVTFTSLTLQPLTAAAQLPSRPKPEPARSDSGEERYSRLLKEMHEILKEVVPQAAMPHRAKITTPAAGKPGEKVLQAVGPKMRLESEQPKPLPGVDVKAKVKSLRAKYKELKSLEAEVDKGFKATEKHIRDHKLPAEILARQETAVAEYEKRKAEFDALMQSVESADDGKGSLQAALTGLGDFMAKYPNEKTFTPTDPNNLPWGSPKPVTRAPYTSPSQFKTSRLFGEQVKVAQAGSISGISLPNTTLPATPNAGDLAATDDVQITQPIRDLATSLGNQPVAIYNWVRNNIQFVPSYGSIQGSDMTLQTKRGNSFDIASLLIALLRAAGIPARYVYGTIQVPVDKAMNWVGGVTAPNAVLNLLGQGGIPARGVGSAGQIQSIQLEHVWVEAFVDYTPSRGAVNRNPNTWVPMDASFKQYQYTQGMDLGTNVPLDGQALVNQLQQSATVNEAEGWVSNVDQTLVQQALTNYQNQVTSYVNSQNPNATLGDVIGTQTIVQQSGPILFGTLPYSRVATGAELQVLPDNLRWKFRYAVYASDSDLAQDSPMINLLRSTASVGSQKITLSYSAATPQDQAVIDGIFPTTSFPAYLIHVVPELRVDGQLTASGPPFGLGTELIQVPSYYNPGTGQWEPGEPNRPTVGEYVVTALDLQGIGSGQLTTLTSRIAQTQATLQQVAQNPADPTPLQTLTKEAVTGDLLYSGLLYYFLSIDSSGQLIAQRAKVVTQRMPSFGNFGVASQVLFLFGVPRTINFSGVLLDIDRVTAADVSKDATSNTVVTFRMAAGSQYSALEHLIPEKLFHISSLPPDDPSQPQAVSAVKALAVAAAQGQRIYTLNSTNEAIHASTISQLGIDAAVKDEISNALAAGKQVTVHQADITYAGFTGSGYVIIDPQTGAGAYKISGGASGAFSKLIVLLLTILMELGNIAVAVLSETGGLLIDAFKTAFSMRDSFEKCDPPAGAWLAGLAVAFFVASILIAMPFTILIAGAWGVLLGAIAAALFSALFDKLIDAMRRNLCGRGPRRRPDFAW